MNDKVSTRRRFFATAGAAVTAPAALAGSAYSSESEQASLAARLAELEDANALRRIGADLIKAVNAGERVAIELSTDIDVQFSALREIRTFDFDAKAQIELSSDRNAAQLRVDCAARFDESIEAPDSLVDMARAQGEGFVSREQQGVLELHCERTPAGWILVKARLR